MRKLLEATTAADAARAMVEQGWEPIPLKARQKVPSRPWGDPTSWDDADISAAFSSASNVGVALGARSGNLVDMDFDWPEAAAIAQVVLSDLPSYGRASAPSSHRLVVSILEKNRPIFQLPPRFAEARQLERAMVLELRGGGHQSMFPPSVHPLGERVSWDGAPESIPQMPAGLLLQKAGLVAFLAVVLRYYPRVPGDRDNICLALTGTLVRLGLSDAEIDAAVIAVAAFAGDEPANARGGKAVATRAAIDERRQTWALPELCKRLGIEELEPTLRGWLGGASSSTRAVTVQEVILSPGSLSSTLDEAEAALLSGGAEIFQREGMLVRVIRLGLEAASNTVVREPGALVIQPVTALWLREQMSRCASWYRPSKDTRVPIDPPLELAKTYLDRVGEWRVSELIGLARAPTLRRDGSILQVEGYDQGSKLYYDGGGVIFPPIPESPTKTDAAGALARLESPLRDFPFVDDLSKSVALSAMLTGLIRGTLATAPLFAIDAPTPGSGKSKIAEMVGVLATGRLPSMMSQGGSNEEDQKRLSSALMAADAVIVVDNCDRIVEGDFLCTALSQEEVSTRILGESRQVRLPTKSVFMATGNNLTLAGDVIRRAVICRLDAGVERPEMLEHDFDPVEEVREHRPELVVAGLTMLRAYLVAGKPTRLGRAMGSFESWDFVRGALVWLGLPDPVESQERLVAADPKRGELAEVLRLLRRTMGSQRFRIAELDAEQFREPIMRALGIPAFSTRSVGRRLSQHVDRPVEGLVLRGTTDSSTRDYWVEELETQATAF